MKTTQKTKGENIFSIYSRLNDEKGYHGATPFAARMIYWPKDVYVVFEEVNIAAGYAIGYAARNGEHLRIFKDIPEWRAESKIPATHSPLWAVVENAPLGTYKTNYSTGVLGIYKLDDRLKWGKYKGFSILEITLMDFRYLEWAIRDLEENFCLSSETINYLTANELEIEPWILELNNEKIAWYESDYADELKPKKIAMWEIEREKQRNDYVSKQSND